MSKLISFVFDWDWWISSKGENRYYCSICKSNETEHKVLSEVVEHTSYGEPVTRRRCTGCDFKEKNRWIPAAW